uniref:EF-hand domain-containing protein n=1 Tax=Plectus sambesii TaxID=2011161 RepID=A0A914VRE9_9BILA
MARIHARAASVGHSRNPFLTIETERKDGRFDVWLNFGQSLFRSPYFATARRAVSTFGCDAGVLRVDAATGINGNDSRGTGSDRALIDGSMSRMGVAPFLLLLCALLLTTLNVNAFPLPNIDSADHVTEHKPEDAKAVFNETDTDQNGRVSFEEFSTMRDGSQVNSEYKELLFAYADVDRDGILSVDEFLNFFEQLPADPSQSVNNEDLRRIVYAAQWFNIYDTDQDGQISPEEAAAMVGQQHSNTKSLSKLATLVLFDNADSDKDSRLKFMEFVIFMTSVEDTLKKAEVDSEMINANASTTEEAVTDYMEPVEGVTGSVNSPVGDSAELTDSQPKTAPPEWAPFIQTTTETPLALGESIDKILLPPPPPLIADTSNEFNITSVDAGSLDSEEALTADSTTTASTPAEQKTAATKPFVAGGDFMKDPPAEAELLVATASTEATPSTESTPSTPSTPATEPTVAALALDNLRQSDSHESAVDSKQADWEKALTDAKLSSAEELELAAVMNQMGETSTPADDSSSSTTAFIGGNLPPSVAPTDVIEQAPSVEVAPPSDPAASMNKAILEMADQDYDDLITMAEAFDFVRVFIKVTDYLMLESLFVQNDQDGDRKLNSNEYVAFLKALVDGCTQVTEDSCEEIRVATFADQAPADASAIPLLNKEQTSESEKAVDVPETTTAPSAETPESVSSTAEPLKTDIPILFIENPQTPESQSSEEITDDALIAAMLREAAEQAEVNPGEAEEEHSAPASTETENSTEEFAPVLIIEQPQEMPRAKTPSGEDIATLTALLLQESSENESGKDKSSQSSETSHETETTSMQPEEFAEKMELIGFGGDVDTTTSTQAPPVMSEESEQNLIADSKSTDVQVMRLNEGDFHYFAHLHDSALYLFIVALFLVLLIVVLGFVVARRVSSRREKIYNVS